MYIIDVYIFNILDAGLSTRKDNTGQAILPLLLCPMYMKV